MQKLQFIPSFQFKEYSAKLDDELIYCLNNLKEKEFTQADFKNYMLNSAVSSSQIEGSTLNLNSYYKAKQNKVNSKEVIEIEGLLAAYQYAKRYPLTQNGLLKCHEILSKNFKSITKRQKGIYRKTQVGIRDIFSLIYLAAEPQFVEQEMNKLFTDIAILLQRKLTAKQVLFYAAYIHFLFVKIHPFADGNGRAARLLEKWFIAQKIGIAAWGIFSESYYYENRRVYYGNLNIGVNYNESLERLNKTTPFLLMLPKAVCFVPTP